MTKFEEEKFKILIDEYGGNINKVLSKSMCDSLVPSICMNEGCDATYDYEPDQDKGWCEKCDKGSVKSILIIYGV